MEYYFRGVKSKLYSNDVRSFTFVKDSTLCLDIEEQKGPGWELLLLQPEVLNFLIDNNCCKRNLW